jgi:hypothetical protein
MARLRAAPFIDVLSPLDLKAKTEDGNLPHPWAPALFSYSDIGVRHRRLLQQDAHDENPLPVDLLYYEKHPSLILVIRKLTALDCVLRLNQRVAAFPRQRRTERGPELITPARIFCCRFNGITRRADRSPQHSEEGGRNYPYFRPKRPRRVSL